MVPSVQVDERIRPTRTVLGLGVLARDLVRLTRPGQWPKNVLVVSVPLLDLRSWDMVSIWRVGWAVSAFTLASILVYIANDITDRGIDAANPAKRDRPIASGRVSPRLAIALAGCVLVLLLAVLSLQSWTWVWPIGAYLVLNAGYSLGIKHVPLLDIFLVAAGFGLRLVQGYVAIGTEVSGWLFTCVFSLCLLLTVGKRHQELVASGAAHRPALRGYTLPLTEQLMGLTAVLTAGAYLLYLRTEAPLGDLGTTAAALLTPLALFGLFRYLQLVLVRGAGADPVRTLLRDPALVINALLWAGLSGGLLIAFQVSQ